MATLIDKVGYGQVEPNRLTAQKTREVFSQLPADDAITTIENGMFLVYDQVQGKVVKPGAEGAKACLVMNEIILEDESYQADSDYVMKPFAGTNYQPAMKAYPRLYAMHVGDTFTTNLIKTDAGGTTLPNAGDKFIVGTDGILEPVGEHEATSEMIFAVVAKEDGKTNRLPDGQQAVKLVVIKA